jgi:putative FmdB family regulatory protein
MYCADTRGDLKYKVFASFARAFSGSAMPIYAYKCASCGYAKDVLQKIFDPRLTVCPQCGKPALQKQVTAAGFQLKGTGWYVTDFRGGSGGSSSPAESVDKDDGKTQAKPEQAKEFNDGAAQAKGSESNNQSSTSGTSAAAPASAPSTSASSSSGNAVPASSD